MREKNRLQLNLKLEKLIIGVRAGKAAISHSVTAAIRARKLDRWSLRQKKTALPISVLAKKQKRRPIATALISLWIKNNSKQSTLFKRAFILPI